MSISGNLRTMPFPDLLQWISLSHKTGALIIKGSRFTKKMLFADGSVTAVTSNNPKEHLGHYLLGWQYLTEEKLRELLEIQRDSRCMLGELLVTRGELTPEQVAHVLRVKTEETVFDLMLWEEGEFFFLDDASPARKYQELSLPVDHFIFEGARQADERRRMREVIPDSTAVVRLLCLPEEARQTPLEREVLARMNGELPLETIALTLRLPKFDVLSLAYRSVTSGQAEVVPTGARKSARKDPESWRSLLQEAEARLSIGSLLEAYSFCSKVRSTFGGDPKAMEAVISIEVRIEDDLRLGPLNGEVIIEHALSVEQIMNLNCAPEEGFVLSRINGFFSLPQILAQLPGDRMRNLLNLHNLLRRGIIRVQRSRGVSKFPQH